jgi:hypothetical protein
MTDSAPPTPRSPLLKLAALTLLVVVGLTLFFLFARRTPVVVRPAESELSS